MEISHVFQEMKVESEKHLKSVWNHRSETYNTLQSYLKSAFEWTEGLFQEKKALPKEPNIKWLAMGSVLILFVFISLTLIKRRKKIESP